MHQNDTNPSKSSSVEFQCVHDAKRKKRGMCLISLVSCLNRCAFVIAAVSLRFVKCQCNTNEIIGDFLCSSPDGCCSANSPANRPTLDWRDSKGQRAWPTTSSPSCSRDDIWPEGDREKKTINTHSVKMVQKCLTQYLKLRRFCLLLRMTFFNLCRWSNRAHR